MFMLDGIVILILLRTMLFIQLFENMKNTPLSLLIGMENYFKVIIGDIMHQSIHQKIQHVKGIKEGFGGSEIGIVGLDVPMI